MRLFILCALTLFCTMAVGEGASIHSIELRVNSGILFSHDIGRLSISEDSSHHDAGSYAEITNEDDELSYSGGIDADIFITRFVGLNFGVQYITLSTPDPVENILFDPAATSQFRELSSPGSDIDGFLFSLGPVFKYRGAGFFERFNPYVGVSFSYLSGDISNSNFGNGVPPPVGTYGVGGSTGVSAQGYTVRLGFSYFMRERLNIGFEYRYSDLSVDDTDQNYRSYDRGFESNLETHLLLATIGWKWDM